MASYNYDPLDAATGEIRVLDLVPGCGETIECHLRHIPLRAPDRATEPYEALSYCWGDDAASVGIVVNGRAFGVTPNLYTALRHLRGRNGADGAAPRTLWVDAICINQQNDIERGVQVPRMSDIYMSCRRVVIWLGEADAYTRPAFDGLALMASRAAWEAPEEFIWRHWRGVRLGRRPGDAAVPGPRWVGGRLREGVHYSWTFHRLFGRPWFTRLWVVQELALCPHAVMHCGPFTLDWDVVARVYASWPSIFERSDHLGALLRIREPPARPSVEDFLDLMLKVWHKDCRNPRDKIYGIVGLARMRNIDVPVAADYTRETDDVFTDLTMRYLKQTKNLQVLAICRGCKTASGPSWAINPAYTKAEDPVPGHLISWHPRFSGALRAGGVPGQPLRRCTPVFDGNLLGLEGFPLDTVVAVSRINRPPLMGSNLAEILEDFHLVITRCQFYLDAKRLVPRAALYNSTGQTTMEAFWCTIMGACPPDPSGHADPSDLYRGNQRYSSDKLRQLLTSFETADQNLARFSGLLAIGGWITWLVFVFIYGARMISILTKNTTADSDPVINSISITTHRRFFVTADGYMGVGPQTARPGDQVLIVQGHGAPLVARQGRQWRVVGDCHVLGVMEGEAFSTAQCRPFWFA